MAEAARDDVRPQAQHEGELREEIEAAMAPPRSHARFPLFDSLRGLAAISILVVHVAIFTGGFSDTWHGRLVSHLDIGVPFFFLLSGFLLYRPMLASRVIGLPRQRLRDYARNRFLRIFPAFWVVLTVAAILPGMYGAFTGNWWVYYLLLDNYPVYTAQGTCAVNPFDCGLPQAWSLGLEVAFYVTLPLFAWLISLLYRTRLKLPWLASNLTVLAVVSLASFWIQSSVPVSDLDQWLFYSPLGRGWWFALGMAVAALSVRQQQSGSVPELLGRLATRPVVPWGLAIGAYVAASLLVLEPGPSLNFPTTGRWLYLFEYGLFGIVAALILIPVVFDPDGRGLPQRLLQHRLLIWLGLISYGIFLWHFPVMAWLIELGMLDLPSGLQFPVLAAATFALTVALASASYYLLEKPLMVWTRGRSRPQPGAGFPE